MTHNTSECCKYKKDRTLKNGFHKKVTIGQTRHGNCKKDHSNSFVQFMEHFSKLEKAVKKTQKSSQKKKHCHKYSNSNKKSKLDICVTPSCPDKATVASKITSTSKKSNHNKIKHSPPSSKKGEGDGSSGYGQVCSCPPSQK